MYDYNCGRLVRIWYAAKFNLKLTQTEEPFFNMFNKMADRLEDKMEIILDIVLARFRIFIHFFFSRVIFQSTEFSNLYQQ